MDPEGPLVSNLFLSVISATETSNSTYFSSFLIIGLLLLCAGFFSASETIYAFANRFRLRVWADKGNKKAKQALYLIENIDKLLSTVMIFINLLHAIITAMTSVLAIRVFGEAVGSVVTTIVVTLLVFIFGDTIPKNIAQTNCDVLAAAFAYPLRALVFLLTPITIIYRYIAKFIKKITKSHEVTDNNLSEDDLSDIIESVENEGVLDADESDIIQAAIDFGDTIVKDVLTPVNDIIAVDINITQKELTDLLVIGTYSRYPVYDGNIDNIIGILHLRSYMKNLSKSNGKELCLRDMLIEPFNVHMNATLDDIFEGFKKNKTHIAIVKDIAFEHTIGMVTMEDVLEELIGNDENLSQEKEGAIC